jgi:nucleoside-diphosphate-sugar epimerase
VEDLVEMIIDSLENKKAENEILFAVSTPKISQQEFVGLIKEVMHSKVINLHLPHFVVDLAAIISDFFAFFSPKTPLLNRQKAREFKQRFWLADNRKMKSILNLTPQKDLRQQIEETYNWYKRQGWL